MAKKKCEVLVINNIAQVGLKRFPSEIYSVVKESKDPWAILVRSQDDVVGVVHVRDTLQAEDTRPIEEFVRPAFELAADRTVYTALAEMRSTRNHLAVVRDGGGAVLGVITLSDVLVRLLPSAEPSPEPARA